MKIQKNKGGIHAGDQLIEDIVNLLDENDIDHKVTKQSGATFGDGDVLTKGYAMNIAFDGKFKITPNKSISVTDKELNKIIKQAENTNRIGCIVANSEKRNVVCIDLDNFVSLLTCISKE